MRKVLPPCSRLGVAAGFGLLQLRQWLRMAAQRIGASRRPAPLAAEVWAAPDSALAARAREVAHEAYDAHLLGHGERTWALAMAVATHLGLRPDPEALFVACLLHDLGLTPLEFDTLLEAGRLTQDLGEPGRDDSFGHGLIDAQRAVLAALELENGGVLPGILSATPGTLDFGAFADTRSLELRNAGGQEDPVIVTELVVDRPWLSVAPTATDANGLGTYSADVDRAQLPENGSFLGRIRVTANTGSLEVTARVTQASPDELADAGVTFFLLVDPNAPPGARFEADVLEADAGAYTFLRSGVVPDGYEVYAGSDFDNDGVICEPGESCGIFPTTDAPSIVNIVDDDRLGLDFVTAFRAGIEVLPAAAGADGAPAARRGIRIRKPEPPR